jgi:hypothetical protein
MFFSRSDFDFESILLFGKDLHLGFGLCPRRRKGKTGPKYELQEVGRVVRCGVEHGHNVARGARGGLTDYHRIGQERGGIRVELLN